MKARDGTKAHNGTPHATGGRPRRGDPPCEEKTRIRSEGRAGAEDLKDKMPGPERPAGRENDHGMPMRRHSPRERPCKRQECAEQRAVATAG